MDTINFFLNLIIIDIIIILFNLLSMKFKLEGDTNHLSAKTKFNDEEIPFVVQIFENTNVFYQVYYRIYYPVG